MTAIGFIGMGIMGAPMAGNLVRAGYEVRAYGRSAASRDRAIAAGVAAFDSVGETVDGADIVITVLPDGPDVRDVLLGDGSVIDRLARDALVIDMSSISPATAREVASAGREHGIGVLDAPVSGGEAAAIEGSLSIMVGGSPADFGRAEPLLRAMGTNVTLVGEAGAGQTVKAANQLIVAGNIQAVAEAIVFLERAAVDVERALAAISTGLAGSAVLERKRSALLSGDFTPGFRVTLHHKDLRIVQGAAMESGLALPLASLMMSLMASLEASGAGEQDHSALLWLARRMNGEDYRADSRLSKHD